MSFVHLHLHSEYSLLDGACRIKQLVGYAKELGQTAVAVTDHGCMYSAVEFYNDYITIDKASGAKANYRHWISNDLFYVDSKVCYMDLPIKKKGGTIGSSFFLI